MTDYIRLPRSVLTDVLWRNPYAARLYFYLLRKADGNGEWKVSLKDIHGDLGLTKQQYRIAMDILKATPIATSKGTAKATSISLCGIESKRTAKTPKTIPKATPIATSKFTPPTDEEVAVYVAKKGYHFNPAEFVPFYQMRGWKMKGGEQMKDWKAGCRYWETNWKQKHGERFYYEMQPSAGRGALAAQADRYSELERAAGAVLRNAPYYNPTKDD